MSSLSHILTLGDLKWKFSIDWCSHSLFSFDLSERIREHFFVRIRQCKLNPATPHFESNLYFMDCRLEHSISQPSSYEMDSLKEFIKPKTFHKLSYAANVCWIVIGIILFAIFVDIHTAESRFDFKCTAKSDEKDVIQGKCFDQYQQRNKLGIPVYAFVLINFFLIAIVTVAYSLLVESRVDQHLSDRRNPDSVEGQPATPSKKIFKAYFIQLTARLCLLIALILLPTLLLYPNKFPSNFECHLGREGNDTATPSASNITQTQTYECHNARAAKKTFWTQYATTVVNGTFAVFVLIEIVWILSRAIKRNEFMEDSQFVADYLNSNLQNPPQQIPLSVLPPQLQDFIRRMKDGVIKGTKQLTDLKQPQNRPKPGEGTVKDLNIDDIYVHLKIQKGRAYYDFTGDRQAQLKIYPKPDVHPSKLVRPEKIIDSRHKNVLVVGRPGIGKTILSTRLLRDWASERAFNKAQNKAIYFDVALLLKFRRFNSESIPLNLRELLARSETVECLDDEVWEYINSNPEKVLLIFDGLDEFTANSEIGPEDDSDRYKNTKEEKMPLHALYNKIASGKLLNGAAVITTARPDAVKYVTHLTFDRAVEILGFSSEKVERYVYKFTGNDKEAGKTIWQHISSHINLFSLCYIPMNCFILCHVLLEILNHSNSAAQNLPTKLTEIYSIFIKIFFFTRNRDDEYSHCKTKLDMYIRTKFDELRPENKKVFKPLGEIAFNGIKESRLIFGSSEVKGLENCGLLHQLPDKPGARPFQPREEQFCFLHLTIQEFLAAKHLTETMNDEELRKFVTDHIKDGKWHMVMQFVAGLLGDRTEAPTDMFTDLLPESTEKEEWWLTLMADEDSERRTLTCWPTMEDKHLAVNICKCLNEMLKVDDSAKVKNSGVQAKLGKIGFNAVDFSWCSLAPVDCAAIAHVLQHVDAGILCMNLHDNNIGDLGCTEIQKFIVNSDHSKSNYKLDSLNLAANGITDAGVKHLAEALTNNNCKINTLYLSYNDITDAGVKHLAEALTNNNCKINILYLSNHPSITDAGVKHLAEALTNNNCKINTLNLSGNRSITDAGVKHLTEALTNNNCKINTLNLRANLSITDKGVKHLAEALTNNNCKINTLNLSSNLSITDAGVKHLAEALANNNCKINTLDLSDNRSITDAGVKHLAEALANNNCKINTLDLSENLSITDAGVKHLAKALTNNNCKINTLVLSGNDSITDAGVKHLAEALTNNNCKINTLALSDNGITDAGVKHLAEALKHNNFKLTFLHLSSNEITAEYKEHLREAFKHSNCKLII